MNLKALLVLLAGLAVLAGDYPAEGRLPIDFGLADGSP